MCSKSGVCGAGIPCSRGLGSAFGDPGGSGVWRVRRGAQLAVRHGITLQACLAAILAAASCSDVHAEIAVKGDDVTVAITATGAAGSAPGMRSGVMLNIEVTEERAAELYGYRSMSVLVDLDCRAGKDRVRKALAFERPRLAGASQLRRTSGEWVRPTPGAYMSDVIQEVCSRAGFGAAPPVAAPVEAPIGTIERPPPASRPTGFPTAPPAPAPLGPAAASPARTGGARVRAQIAASTSEQAAQSEAAAPPRSSGSGLRAQIASSTSEQAAHQALDQAKAQIQPPLTGAVEAAEVRGRTAYRSVVVGFASEAGARAFCARMQEAHSGCIVWGARGVGRR